jgi:excisionase family DNA binding protein
VSDGFDLHLPPDLIEQIAVRAAEIVAERETPEPDGFLDASGAADFLACGTSRIYSLVSAGRLPIHRDGSRLLFDRAELRAYVRAIGVILVLGFLLLLIAFQAPLIAAIGVLANLLSTAAAFGVATLIFQHGHLSGLLGFESQGFLDAWGPIFFFAMIFAIAMDYTVFLLSSAREHWERSGDAKKAMVGGLAHSGRVILAAGGVMVAVFFTFALSGPLPPKEMGTILGVAVLLDAFLVRLLLLPVFLRLAGARAWYLPAWLDRILPDVHFGHGEAEPEKQPAPRGELVGAGKAR